MHVQTHIHAYFVENVPRVQLLAPRTKMQLFCFFKFISFFIQCKCRAFTYLLNWRQHMLDWNLSPYPHSTLDRITLTDGKQAFFAHGPKYLCIQGFTQIKSWNGTRTECLIFNLVHYASKLLHTLMQHTQKNTPINTFVFAFIQTKCGPCLLHEVGNMISEKQANRSGKHEILQALAQDKRVG